MHDQLVNAVYEHGSFRPLEPLSIEMRNGDLVRLRIEAQGEPPLLELAGQVYDGLSPSEIEEIERVALDRSNFFRARDNASNLPHNRRSRSYRLALASIANAAVGSCL